MSVPLLAVVIRLAPDRPASTGAAGDHGRSDAGFEKRVKLASALRFGRIEVAAAGGVGRPALA